MKEKGSVNSAESLCISTLGTVLPARTPSLVWTKKQRGQLEGMGCSVCFLIVLHTCFLVQMFSCTLDILLKEETVVECSTQLSLYLNPKLLS